jgi:hypothetical protein
VNVANELGSTVILFPPFRLDPVNEQLWRGKQIVALKPKTFAVFRRRLKAEPIKARVCPPGLSTPPTARFVNQEGTARYCDSALAAWVLHHLLAPAPQFQSPGTATSPQGGHPREVRVSWPSEERWMNHSPVLCRYTAISAFPSPS